MYKQTETCARPLRVFCSALFALTLVGIVLRTLNLTLFYESDIGYYTTDAALPVIMNIFLLAVFAAIGICAIIIPKKPYMTSGTECNIAVRLSSVLSALGFIALAVCALLGYIDKGSGLGYVLIVSALVAAVYFLLTALGRLNNTTALISIAIIAALVYILAVSYFDVFVQMNAPNKMLTHLACLASMMFFVYEARAVTGEKKAKLYVFSLSCALFFTGIASFPAIIAYLSGSLGKYFINVNYVAFDIFFAVLFVYYAVRFVTLMITADRVKECDTEPCEETEEYEKPDSFSEEQTDTSEAEISETSETDNG